MTDVSDLIVRTVRPVEASTVWRIVPVEIDDWTANLPTGDATPWCRETMGKQSRARGYGADFEREAETLVVDRLGEDGGAPAR